MTAFNEVFYSLLCSKIQTLPQKELTIKKNFKFSTSEFPKIWDFEITKQKKLPPPQSPSTVRRKTPSPHNPHSLALRPPTLNSPWRHCHLVKVYFKKTHKYKPSMQTFISDDGGNMLLACCHECSVEEWHQLSRPLDQYIIQCLCLLELPFLTLK